MDASRFITISFESPPFSALETIVLGLCDRHQTDFGRWETMWEVLAMMGGLKYLQVTLMASQNMIDEEWHLREDLVFQPIRKVTTPKNFVVKIPWESSYAENTSEPLPCQLVSYVNRSGMIRSDLAVNV